MHIYLKVYQLLLGMIPVKENIKFDIETLFFS